MSTKDVSETIVCRHCGVQTVLKYRQLILDDDVREWYEVPAGWRVSDAFPPGDEGLFFLCKDCVGDGRCELLKG